jgi:hypothetical protein
MGLFHYFTNRKCKNGHIEKRLTSSGQCLACLRGYQKKYRAIDPEPSRAYARAYRWRNLDQQRLSVATWRQNNPQRIVDYSREYAARKYATDIEYRLKNNLRNRVRAILMGRNKSGSAVRDLGCTVAELRTHIEAQFDDAMSWDNWGSIWQLDHERPLVSFDLTQREQFLQACHYTNLRPLSVDDHKAKSIHERNK